MAKTTPPAPDGATKPSLRVSSPGGPRWRAGRQFGREPVDLTEADVEAMAMAKGLTVEDIVRALTSDPQLSVVPEMPPATAD
jgi:hypothetical protein